MARPNKRRYRPGRRLVPTPAAAHRISELRDYLATSDLYALAQLHNNSVELERRTRLTVAALRIRHRVPWRDIAAVFGTSVSTCHQRYAAWVADVRDELAGAV